MERIDIYEYDKRNREEVVVQIEACSGMMISWSHFIDEKGNFPLPTGTKGLYVDISTVFANEDKVSALISIVESVIGSFMNDQPVDCYIIIDKRYSKQAKDLLYFKINTICNLEERLEILVDPIKNVVDIAETEFSDLIGYLDINHFGNNWFRRGLAEELKKYRLFNKIGYQPIFSLFICGTTGIGKTEIARLLHKFLSPAEPMIKINFGNYSSESALSSLIGSPRGYTGSQSGELTDKLLNSRTKVILIDEFEKASKPVFNFFLQLLEDGEFSDSLGRDYDLNKYIIIFTSNLPKEKVSKSISPELRARFSYKVSLNLLSASEKQEFINFKLSEILKDVKSETGIELEKATIDKIKNFDLDQFLDLRKINNELMNRVSYYVYPLFSN